MVAVSPVLVGRAAEIAVLGESWALARGGSPATVLIGGEAGIGKTRLVRQFTAGVEAEVLYGGCVDFSGGGLPFGPFTAALRGHAETPAELLPRDVQADSDTARARLFEEVLTQFAGLCARRPVVLVIEDTHWIDRSSLDLLSFLVHNQQAAGALLCVVTYRSDELERANPLRRSLAELDRVAWTRRMELPRLTRRAVGSLVGAIAGAEPAASLVAEIHQRSEGIPFFAEVLLDRQDQPGLPESLRDLLLARVARLPEDTQTVLRTASAGVGPIRHELLATVSGLDNGALSAALRPAVAAGVLVVDGDGYRFRHALISEAVRDDQLPGERAAAHRQFAQALAADHALETDGSGSAELAFHWHAAGDASRALEAAWQAAGDAAARLAYAERLDMLERVLELWARVPDAARCIGCGRAAVLDAAVAAAVLAGEDERGVALATAALAGAEGDPVRTAWLLWQRATMLADLGRVGLDDLNAAVRIAPPGHPVRAAVLCALANRLLADSRNDEAEEAAAEALDIARAAGDARIEAQVLIVLATRRARRGDLAAELPRLAEAEEAAARLGAHGVRMLAVRAEATVLVAFGVSLPAGTEERLAGFTELAGTAIANAEAQAALTASRARIVATADQTRRRIERDLHDGVQQRLVSLALRLREVQAAPPEAGELAERLEGAVTEATGALEELREIARGLHPTVLAEGGLRPALRALARRSAVPVRLDIQVAGRLPEPVEIAAYYAVSEALTNTAKHARASAAEVEVTAGEGILHVRVRDDGRGGADLRPRFGPDRAQGPDGSARRPDLPPQPARGGHHPVRRAPAHHRRRCHFLMTRNPGSAADPPASASQCWVPASR